MKPKKLGRVRMPRLEELPCEELGPDDGVDPRVFFRNEQSRGQDRRKDRQLCKQTAQALSFALAELPSRGWADGLMIAEVIPAPDASRLRVTVAVCGVCTAARAVLVTQSLKEMAGALRWEVGAAITRKRVPQLLFELAPEENAA